MSKILDIQFKDNENDLKEMQEHFNTIGRRALFMSHYELADATDMTPIEWKKFITDIRVSTVLNEELDLIKKSKVALMLKDIETNKNTGQAQLLNTLLNQTKQSDIKEGPVFIYTQIPLNEQEQHAPNVRRLENAEDNTTTISNE